ncbi:MAG TPA: TIGR03790 family protein, partial [Pyrinomonadaceae bacterium]|nr:TIGR03790 family protein [Pyrinomonadaceae bacterium]
MKTINRRHLKLDGRRFVSLTFILAAAFGWLAWPTSSLSQSSTPIPLNQRVLVVYSTVYPESLDVANYYMTKRGIPAANKCAVTPVHEHRILDWDVYESSIKAPIRTCLDAVGRDKILYIVFSHMTPYKVGPDSYLRSLDQQIADIWDEYSPGIYVPGTHPYYADAQSQGNVYLPFVSLADFRQQPSAPHLYSVWHLEGPNATVAKGLVDKAMQAETSGLTGQGYFDGRGYAPDAYDAGTVPDYRHQTSDWDVHRSADFVRRSGITTDENFNDEEYG